MQELLKLLQMFGNIRTTARQILLECERYLYSKILSVKQYCKFNHRKYQNFYLQEVSSGVGRVGNVILRYSQLDHQISRTSTFDVCGDIS